MGSAITPTSGHAARALRFYNEGELFLGFGVSGAWDDEAAPPAPSYRSAGIGHISAQVYVGSSLGSGNCVARVVSGTAPYTGNAAYYIKALSATHYEVRAVVDDVLQGAAYYVASAVENVAAIPGLSLKVSSTTMTADDTYTFNADGVLGFKLCATKHLVVPDVDGTITYRGQQWLIVAPEDARVKAVRHLYIQGVLVDDELPVGITYHQVGIFSSLVRADGVSEGLGVLLPEQVADAGGLELLDNRGSVTRFLTQSESYSYIIEC